MINIQDISRVSIQEELENVKIYSNNLKQLYNSKCKDGWIIRTIKDYKIRYKIEKANYIVHVGCGLFPYSILSLHKQLPDKNYIGLEYDFNRHLLAKKLIKKLELNNIEIVHIEALSYDYSYLDSKDFVFITTDVLGKKIFSSIVEKTKAHVFMCAPYSGNNLQNYL